MKFNIEDFISEHKYNETLASYLEGFTIENVEYYKNLDKCIIKISNKHVIPFLIYKDLLELFKKTGVNNVSLVIKSIDQDLSLSDVNQFLNEFNKDNNSFKSAEASISPDGIVLNYLSEEYYSQDLNCIDELKLFFYNLGYRKEVSLKLVEKKEYKEEIAQVYVPNKPIENKQVNNTTSNTSNKDYYKKNRKKEDYKDFIIDELVEGLNRIRVKGTIFKVCDPTVTKAGNRIIKFYIKDTTNACAVKYFERDDKFPKKFTDEFITVGKNIIVSGSYVPDNFERDDKLLIKPDFIEEDNDVVSPIKKDDAEVKRVELHSHSNRSEFDGVCDPKEIAKAAYKMGHKAIALTDHYVVQGFKHFQDTCSDIRKSDPDRDFKVIYGCEFDVTNPTFNIVYNCKDKKLKEAEYVVFDLETTGLSINHDHIIEFGAVLFSKGSVVEEKDFFINPQVKLKTKIKELTSINDSDVAGARPFVECVDEILDFIKGRVLVAHNASFDYNFLNEELRRIGHDPIDNITVDTLDLSKALFPEKNIYRLGTMCNNYGVEYNEDEAHRANYDARVLASVFWRMLNDLETKNIFTFQELNKFNNEDAYKKNRAYHLTALAKNKAGLKDLYRLVSISHCDRLVKNKPRLTKQDIIDHRENLLIGSSCLNGEVFEIAQTRSFNDLRKTISFFDYIEIQPLDNYRGLIEDRELYDWDELKMYLKDIVEAAKLENKLIVATGDVHFITDEEKTYRDVYINAKRIGGDMHPLYVRNKEKRLKQITPNQKLFTTNEMLEFYKWLDDDKLVYDMVVTNTNKIADMCEYYEPFSKELFAPRIKNFETNEYIDVNKVLTDIVYENAHKMYGEVLDPIIDARLKKELEAIIGNGYAGIYYTCHLMVKRSNQDGYVVGSRGSVGSSLVATMSGITECNPLPPHYVCPKCHKVEWIDKYKSGYDMPDKVCPTCNVKMINEGHNIPFETFLGFHGDKTPDIDLNFSGDYQPKAHLFTREIFGPNNVFRAGTIGTVADKTAFGYVTGYMEEMDIPYMSNAQHERLAAGCTDVKRTTGQHAGGIVVLPDDKEIEDFTPLQYPANKPESTWKTTHFDYHDYNDNLLKFDILGHDNPTAMRLLENLIERYGTSEEVEKITGIKVNKVSDIPMNDEKVLSLFNSSKALNLVNPRYDEVSIKLLSKLSNETNEILLKCKDATGALGLPEFGTGTSRKTLFETRPNTFSQLVQLSGLSHGTDVWAGNAQTLVRSGIPLDDVIGCRDDIMSTLMSYKLDPSDSFFIMEHVRKGKGLTEKEEQLMLEHNVPKWYIESCRKIKYMFPKAHAVAYCIDSVRIAWFKYYYPLFYYIQFFTLRCWDYEYETMIKEIDQVEHRLFELKELIDTRKAENKDENIYDTLEVVYEMQSRGYRISKLNLKLSEATQFILDPNDPKAIIPPFVVLGGLGTAVAESVVKARNESAFISIEDLSKRTQLSKTHIDTLKRLGVLAGLPDNNMMPLF